MGYRSIIFRSIASLLPLLLCAWPSVNLGGSVPAAAGGGWGDSCTPSSGVVYCMDFDGTGCANSSTNTCTAPAGFEVDCDAVDDSQCPLSGTYSARQTADSGQIRVTNSNDLTITLAAGETLRCAFDFYWDVDGGDAEGEEQFFAFYTGGTNAGPGLWVDFDEAGAQTVCPSDGSATRTCAETADTFDLNTETSFCLEYEYDTDTTTVWTNRDCSGGSYASESGGVSEAIDGFRVLQNTDNWIIVDNIKCEVDP